METREPFPCWILLLVLVVGRIESKSCSMFRGSNCSCFSTDSDVPSILYCRLTSLRENPFEPPFGGDYFRLKSFETISIDLSTDDRVELKENALASLGSLSSNVDPSSKVELSIKIDGFNQLKLSSSSINSNIFGKQTVRRDLNMHLIPSVSARSSVRKIFAR